MSLITSNIDLLWLGGAIGKKENSKFVFKADNDYGNEDQEYGSIASDEGAKLKDDSSSDGEEEGEMNGEGENNVSEFDFSEEEGIEAKDLFWKVEDEKVEVKDIPIPPSIIEEWMRSIEINIDAFNDNKKRTTNTLGNDLHNFIQKFSGGSNQKAKAMEKELLHGIIIPTFGGHHRNIPLNLDDHRITLERNQSKRTMYIDCCINGCMVFVGKDKKLNDCLICGKFRCLQCREYICRTIGVCSCIGNYNKKSEKNMFYRPIIGTVNKLLEFSRFPGLLDYVATKHKSFLSYDVKHGKRLAYEIFCMLIKTQTT